MSVSIKAQFGKDDRELNGLERIVKELVDSPLKRRIVIGFVEVVRVTKDIKDGGTETPTVQFLQIEPLEGETAERARMMLAEAYEARTGQSVEDQLDFDTLDEPEGEGEPDEQQPAAE